MIQCGEHCPTGRDRVLLGEQTHSRRSVVGGGVLQRELADGAGGRPAKKGGKGQDSQAEEGKPRGPGVWNLGSQVGVRQGRAPHGAWVTTVWALGQELF